MGSYTSHANTDKHFETGDEKLLSYGVCNMQGWRRNQEDAHISNISFDDTKSLSLFAVFDGHGGAEVAQYCALHFGDILKATEAYQKGHYALALRNAFLDTDLAMRKEKDFSEICECKSLKKSSYNTAVCALYIDMYSLLLFPIIILLI